MTAYDDARVLVMVADYAGADAGGKINAIGAAFNLTQLQPPAGLTPPQHVVAVIDTPQRLVGTEFTLTVELRRADPDEVVTVSGQDGRPEAVRVSQVIRPTLPDVPAGLRISDTLHSRSQLLFGFPTGLQLESGVAYRWQVEIDGRSRPEWQAHFEILAPAPGPVFGGPSTPIGPDFPTI